MYKEIEKGEEGGRRWASKKGSIKTGQWPWLEGVIVKRLDVMLAEYEWGPGRDPNPESAPSCLPCTLCTTAGPPPLIGYTTPTPRLLHYFIWLIYFGLSREGWIVPRSDGRLRGFAVALWSNSVWELGPLRVIGIVFNRIYNSLAKSCLLASLSLLCRIQS